MVAPPVVEYEIRQFDPTKMTHNRICVFLGSRGSGKSVAMKDVVYHNRTIPRAVCMSATEESNGHWGDCIPPSYIYPDYDPNVVSSIVTAQRRAFKKLRGTNQKPQAIAIICEDVMYDKTLSKDMAVRQIFLNGRHHQILFLLTVQYITDIPPSLRTQIDYLFCWWQPSVEERVKLWRFFFGIFPTFEMFDQVFRACTNDFECLILDNTRKSNRVEDSVFVYKARIREGFKVGSPAYWQFHFENYDPTADDSEEEEQDAAYHAGARAKRGTICRVSRVGVGGGPPGGPPRR